MDDFDLHEALERRHAAEARRDRWLVPLIVVFGMTAGAAFFGAGMFFGSHFPARCAPAAAAPRA